MSNTPDNNQLDPIASRVTALEVDLIVDPIVNHSIDVQKIREAVSVAADLRGFQMGRIGVRVTDDPTIHELNRKHIGHDYPTDVISFGYEEDRPFIEGELVVSVDTAAARAGELGWPVGNELLLYVVHGVLHITGMDDHQPEDRKQMRKAEQQVLVKLGIEDAASYDADFPAASAAIRSTEDLP